MDQGELEDDELLAEILSTIEAKKRGKTGAKKVEGDILNPFRKGRTTQKIDSEISPVVDPKEICWYCHTHRNDLTVLYKCEGCNPKVI